MTKVTKSDLEKYTSKGKAPDNKPPAPSKLKSVLKNFLIGGFSGMCATSIIQPIDFLKVRIQLQSEAGLSTKPQVVARQVYTQIGVRGFYAGLDSALLRQAVYATMRLGIYFNLSEYIIDHVNHGANLSFAQKTASSFTAGAIGSFIGTPCDLALVRMQADKRPNIPEAERRNYKNVFDAFRRIIAEEGITKMWTGGLATIMRACVMNMWMLVSYDESKERLTKSMPQDTNVRTIQIMASLTSSVFTSCGTLPFDNIKTKVQNQKICPDTGAKPYDGILDCFVKTVKNEGPTGLWAGLPTFYCRVGPHAIITLLTAEYLRRLFNSK